MQQELFDIKKLFPTHPMIEQLTDLRITFLRLRDTLDQLGYIFKYPNEVVGKPEPDIDDKLQPLIEEFGPFPEALRQFYKIIGSLDFMGTHPDWEGCSYPDPLYIHGVDYTLSELETWQKRAGRSVYDILEGTKPEDPFWIFIAPDYFHKSDSCGGTDYEILLPTSEWNPVIDQQWNRITLLEYLVLSAKWGGFPGLEKFPDHRWPLEKIKKGIRY